MTKEYSRKGILEKNESAFLLVFGVYVFISLVESSLLYNESVLKVVKLITALLLTVLFCLHFCSQNQYRFVVFAAFVIGISFTVAFFATDRFYLFIYAMMIILAGDTDFRHVAKTSFFSALCAVIVIIVSIALGFIEDYIYISGSRVSHCLGFIYYSFFPFIVYFCVLMYLYLRGKKTGIIEYCGLLVVSYYIYKLSTLRLAFALSLFTLLFHILVVKLDIPKIQSKAVTVLAGLAFPAGAGMTFMSMKLYNDGSNLWARMDNILSGRINLMSRGLEKYPIRLLGNNVEMRGNNIYSYTDDYFYLDSGFAYSLLAYGLLFTFAVILLYSVIFIFSCITNDRNLFVWVASVLLFTMINNTWVSIDHNPVLLCSLPALKYLFHCRHSQINKGIVC